MAAQDAGAPRQRGVQPREERHAPEKSTLKLAVTLSMMTSLNCSSAILAASGPSSCTCASQVWARAYTMLSSTATGSTPKRSAMGRMRAGWKVPSVSM